MCNSRADCPVDTGIVQKSFWIMVFLEGTVKKFVTHITYFGGFSSSLLSNGLMGF